MEKEFVVVLSLEHMAVGDEIIGRTWPLHCTVMPWFSVDTEEGVAFLKNTLMRMASQVQDGSLELMLEKRAFFGIDADVPVHILARNEQLELFHVELLDVLERMKCLPSDVQYAGARYRPHVTDRNALLMVGTRHIPSHLVLVAREACGKKSVCAVFGLGKTTH